MHCGDYRIAMKATNRLGQSDNCIPSRTAGSFTLLFVLVPLIALHALFLGAFTLDWLARVVAVVPATSRFLLDGILSLLFVIVILKRLLQNRSLRRTPIDLPVLVLVATGVTSAVINNEPFLLALLGFRNLFKPILLFYILINLDLRPQRFKGLVIFLMTLELLQIPIMVLQARSYGEGGDLVSGTFGFAATAIVAIVALMIMALFYGLAFTRSKRDARTLVYGLLGTSLFIPFVLGETKAAFFIAPLMLLILVSGNLVRHLKRLRTWLILFSFIGIFLASVQVLSAVNPRSRLAVFLQSPELIVSEYERPLELSNGVPKGRLGDLQFSWQLVTRDAATLLFGFGPAESIETSFLGVTGELRQTYSAFGLWFGYSQMSRTLLERGVITLITYIVAVLILYRTINRMAKRNYFDEYWRGIAFGFKGVVFIFLIATVYWTVWETEATAYVFWALAACLLVIGARKGKEPSPIPASRQQYIVPSGSAKTAVPGSLQENG